MQLPIQSDGLILRRVAEHDFDDLCDFLKDPEVARYQLREPFSDEEIWHLIHSQSMMQLGDLGSLILVVELCSESRVIGNCSLAILSEENAQGDIGFSFNPRYHGHGYATKAVNAALGFGFKGLELHRITAVTDILNERSWKLMERVGMRREGLFIHDWYGHGKWIDDYLYAMLEDEWPGLGANDTPP